ncbi:MAG: hypothetical protein IJ641_07895 [Lachnospiraceae bacterium]|nr:hypothetical protein [Lachnospiraceae bacterium]
MSEPVSMEVHNEAMRRLDAENDRQNHRIDLLEQNIREISDLTNNVGKLAVSMENMAKEQTRQGERLEELEKQDGKMWRTVVTHVVTLIVGAIIAYALSHIGL